jgi:L-asparaginase
MIVLSLHCKKENYINTDCMMNVCKDDASILIIYTGGTIGMIENPETGSLEAFNFEHLEEHVPEL